MSTTETLPENLVEMLKRFNPDQLVHEVTSLGITWTEFNAIANALEESRKTVLAKIQRGYIEQSLIKGIDGKAARPLSIAAAENAALADDFYEDHLNRMVTARKEADAARIRYDMGRMRLELLRSQMATVRQELRNIPTAP